MSTKITNKFLTVSFLALILFVVQTKAQNGEEEDIWGFLSVKLVRGFTASFLAILVSEIGDKTFFIAAIMSMVSVKKEISYCSLLRVESQFDIILEIRMRKKFSGDDLDTK